MSADRVETRRRPRLTRPARLLLLLPLLLGAPLPAAHAASGSPSPAPSASSCPPGLGIGLVDVPADRVEDPRARAYVVDHVAPGTTFARRLRLCLGAAPGVGPARVLVYAVGAQVRDALFAPDPGRGRNDLATWTSAAPAQLTLTPGRPVLTTVTVAVPPDAAAGERYAVVYAEGPPSGSGAVASISRVGIRVYLSVGPGAEPRSDLAVDTLTAARGGDGRPVVQARVRNTGGRALDLTGQLTLTGGPGGRAAGPFLLDRGTTLPPGATAVVRVLLDASVSGGPWQASLLVRSGSLARTVQAALTFPDAVGSAAVPVVPVLAVEDPGAEGVPPVLLGAGGGLLAVLLLAALLALLRRRRRDRRAPPPGPPPGPPEGLVDWPDDLAG